MDNEREFEEELGAEQAVAPGEATELDSGSSGGVGESSAADEVSGASSFAEEAADEAVTDAEEGDGKSEDELGSFEQAGGAEVSPDDDLPPVDDDEDQLDPSTLEKRWYILKAQVNRETSVCDTLRRRIQRFGLSGYFGEMLVPTEDVREFTKAGKSRIVKRKLYPGYIMVNMALTEDSWWLVRDTPGIGDFTGVAGKPTPLGEAEIDKILKASRPLEVEEGKKEDIKTSIKHKVGDKVRVKDGNFENFEGEVSGIDERNGRVTVLINIFGRLNPVELDHWQVEGV